jgi:hypothetical protein
MKLDFIVEANLEDLEAKKPYLVKTYCQGMKTQQEVDGYLSAAADCDPTNGKYIEWILNNIRDRNIRLPEDAEKILNILNDFNKRKTRLTEKDIHRYNPNSLYRALNEIDTVTRSQRKAAYRGNLVVPPGAEILDIEAPVGSRDLVVMRLNNASATMTIASGTNWCVANEASANDYLEAGPLYAFYKNGKKHALLCVPDAFFFTSALERFQYNNTDNDPLPSDQTAAAMKMIQPYTHISPDKYPPLLVYIAREKNEFPSLSDSFFQIPSNAVACAKFYNRRWIEAEPLIKTDLHAAIEYLIFAQTVSNTKYLEAYQEDPDDDDMSGSQGEESELLEWPDIEDKIAKADDDKLVFRYVDAIAEEETPELEARVFKSSRTPEMIDCVIRYVTKFPDCEPRVPEDVLNMIAQDGMLSYNFAEATESRFKLGEKAISSDKVATVAYYLKGFVSGRWPAVELNSYNKLLSDPGEIMSNQNLGDLYVYAALLAKERVPITETALLVRLKKHDFNSPSNQLAASIIKYYAQFFYPSVWPELLEITRSLGANAKNKQAIIRDFFELGFLACGSKSELKIEGQATFLLSYKFDSLLASLKKPLSDMNKKIDKYFI